MIASGVSNTTNGATATGADSYMPLGSQEKPAYSIVVYRVWDFPRVETMAEEMDRRAGRPLPGRANDSRDPLVWGGLYAATYTGMQNFRRYNARWFLYILGIFMPAVLDNVVPGVPDGLFLATGWACIILGLVMYWIGVKRFEKEMKAAEDVVNPIFAKSGYRVSYRIEPTGLGQANVHSFAVFCLQPRMVSAPLLMDVLPRPVNGALVPSEPVLVYLHQPWYRTCLCSSTRPLFAHPPQPEALQSIHPFVWGALYEAFHVHEMNKYRRSISIELPFLVGFFLPWSNYSPRHKLTSLAIGGLVCLFLFSFSYTFLDAKARHYGYRRWTQAVEVWQPILLQFGWQLEYQSTDENTAPTEHNQPRSLAQCFRNSPSVYLRFVPVSV